MSTTSPRPLGPDAPLALFGERREIDSAGREMLNFRAATRFAELGEQLFRFLSLLNLFFFFSKTY